VEGLLGAKGNRAARRRFALLQRIEGLNQKAQGSKAFLDVLRNAIV
jgi:hypothetical protein